MLSPENILRLLDLGQQEILTSFESTFKEIFHSYVKKDPEMKLLQAQ